MSYNKYYGLLLDLACLWPEKGNYNVIFLKVLKFKFYFTKLVLNPTI